jgi:heavy metal efflux system protein
MINAILSFSVRQRLVVILATVIVAGFGVLALKQIPIDAFPDVTNVQVQVLAKAGGMSPPEVEKLVTRPIEIQMGGLPRLTEIRSTSKIGLAAITIVFEDGVNDYFARQLVSERLTAARENLPAGVDVELGPISTGLGEIFQYTLVSRDKKHDATELRTIQDYIVRPLLRTVPGVADVNSFGGFVKQFQVVVRPEQLTSFKVTLQQVFEALARNNANASGNFIEHQSEQYVVRGLGLVKNTQDIANIIVAMREHTPIYVRDVADVKIGAELRQGVVTMNGQGEVVSAIVLMLKGASGRDVVNAVKEKLPAIQKALPKGVELVPFYDRTDLVRKAIHTVMSALEEGAIFVLIVLVVLLADVRSAIIVALVLPLSALFAFIMMKWYGLSANLMSLGGLAIGIGMMVDGAVVMVENIHRHLTEKPSVAAVYDRRRSSHDAITEPAVADRRYRRSKIDIVLYSAREVARPIVFGIAIIIIVFLPLFTLQGFEGKMFSPLAFTISFALLGSLILSLTFVPMLCTFFLKQAPHEHDPFHIRWLKHVYLVALKPFIRRPWRVVLPAVIALIASLLLVPFIGTEFLPSLDEGAVAIEARSLPSISLQQGIDLQTRAQRIFKKFPEVIDAVSKTGRADIATDPMGIDSTDVMLTLRPPSEWTSAKTKELLVEKFRAAFAELPGVSGNFSQPIALRVDELISGVKSAIAIKIFGDDLNVLKDKADAVGRVLSKVRGATDVNVEKVSGLAYLQIEVDRERTARYGINVADIHDVIEMAIGGKEASKVYDGMKVFGLAVRFPESARNDVEPIRQILIPSPSGALIPLGQVAKVEVSEGPAQISREMAQRRIVIECNVVGRDIGSFVQEARRNIDNAVRLPPGYFMTWGGQFENQQRAMKRFAIVVPITIASIFLLLFISFNSIKQAVLIILNIPFALIGGILALVIGGFNLSVSASVGFITLFGVAVLNGVVMVSYFNELRRDGVNLELAVIKGAVLRLRPVLITASVAALGLIPLLFATGPGSEIQKPLAAVVIGGLISSTVLTLFILPTLYQTFELRSADRSSVRHEIAAQTERAGGATEA